MSGGDWPKRYETEYLPLLDGEEPLSWQAWAWEFLRRNREYRNDYELYWELQLEYYTPLFFDVEDQFPLAANGIFPTNPNPKLQAQHVTSPDELWKELNEDQAEAVRQAWRYREDPRVWELDLRRLGWGILDFRDPEQSPLRRTDNLFLSDVLTIRGFGELSLDDHAFMSNPALGDPSGFACWINPNHSLTPQLELIRNLYTQRRQEGASRCEPKAKPDRQSPFDKDLFPMYLLLLDAAEAGVTLVELANAFGSEDPVLKKESADDERRFADRRRAARALTKPEGYKPLVARDEPHMDSPLRRGVRMSETMQQLVWNLATQAKIADFSVSEDEE